MDKELTFTIEERDYKGTLQDKAKVLVDSEGFVCGIFSTVEEAEKAIPAIRYNISRGFVSPKHYIRLANERSPKRTGNRFQKRRS